MRRREFITFVGGVAAFPLAVRAQQTIAPTLGVLLVENREPFSRLFSEGLRDLAMSMDKTFGLNSVPLKETWASCPNWLRTSCV
jgi:hypothetical protein